MQHEHPLSRLDLYVKDTVPRNGQHPFYRAYDVDVKFNRNYVELMYTVAKHDLGIYLFDNDGRPVRDAFGRIITFSNTWRKAGTELTEEEEKYAGLMEMVPCIDFNRNSIPPGDVLESSAKERFLLPQKLYEAKVIPILFHETFEGGDSRGWKFIVEGNKGPTIDSNWIVSTCTIGDTYVHYLGQGSNIYTEINGEYDLPACRGTFALYGGCWTDYRLTVVLASGTDGAIGVMFRYRDQNNYYRFSIDRERKYRRLIKMEEGTVQILGEDEWIYKKNRIYTVTIEAVKDSIRVFMDGEPIFSVKDENPLEGTKVALYCWANTDARFYEVAVEYLREDAPSVYNFQFSSSRYANFFHHIHSFNDRVWKVSLPANSNLNGEKFEEKWPAHIQLSEQVEIHLIKKNTQNIGFLLISPEPVEWERVNLNVKKSGTLIHLGVPGTVKLTSFGRNESGQWVDLLMRADTPLSNWKIEYTTNPQNPQWKPFYTFKGLELFSKTEFSDEDFVFLPLVGGFCFIEGDTMWKNYHFTADFEFSGSIQEACILFRYRDEKNYYKLVVSNTETELVRVVSQAETSLWSCQSGTDGFFAFRDDFVRNLMGEGLAVGDKQRYRITVEAHESKITIFFNGELCCEVDDSQGCIDHGCIGAFFPPGADVTIRELSVISLERKLFPSGQVIRIHNSVKKQGRHFEDALALNTEWLAFNLTGDGPGIAFRIVDENSNIIHERTFLEDEFADAGRFSVVPSADGASALILPDGTTPIEEGNLYRVTFTFSRKKEGFPLLKQWGLYTDETVNIEFRL